MSGSSAGASLEPVRRFEVFTGEGRRRKWALADKMALVAEMAGADNISELARRHGLRPSQLFTWRRELRYAAEAAAPPPFVPAIVAPAPVAVAEALPPPAQGRRTRRSRGTLVRLAPLQPYFIAAEAAALGVGYWLVYRSRIACANHGTCSRPIADRLVRSILGLATMLVVVAVAFNFIAPLLSS